MRFLLIGLLLTTSSVWAQEQPLDASLHESVATIEVDVKDFYGKEETGKIAVTQFLPDGDGPFPILILNHGRAPNDRAVSAWPSSCTRTETKTTAIQIKIRSRS